MNNCKLVSIIIPVYNAQNYLKKCIDSVISQTYKNIEIILIDDGSSDGSKEICKDYLTEDKRIVYLEQENKGAYIARNKGLKIASGDYIQFVDSDDFLGPNYINTLVKAIDNVDLVISAYHVYFYKKNEKLIKKERNPPTTGIFSKCEFLDMFGNFLDSGMIAFLWNKLYKFDIIKNRISFNETYKRGVDCSFNLDYFSNIERINVINSSLYYYTGNNPSSITNNFFIDDFSQKISRYRKTKSFLITHNAYTDKNKNYVEKKHAQFLINHLVNLSKSNISCCEKMDKIDKLINEESVLEINSSFFHQNLIYKIIGLALKFRSALLVYLLLKFLVIGKMVYSKKAN